MGNVEASRGDSRESITEPDLGTISWAYETMIIDIAHTASGYGISILC